MTTLPPVHSFFKMWWAHVSAEHPHLTREQAAMLAVLTFIAEIDGIHTAGPTFKEAKDIVERKLGIAGMLTPGRNENPTRTDASHLLYGTKEGS